MHGNVSYSMLIKEKALSLGFDACGITRAQRLVGSEEKLRNFLANEYHGQMAYLANHFEKRLDPTLLVPGAKSVIVLLLNYFPQQTQSDPRAPVVSKYAFGADYHLVVKQMLRNLFDFIRNTIGSVEGRMFVDSGPVLEREWAVQAGLGWIGKNGLLIHPNLGSFCFIGELIIDLELEYDEPYVENHCGNCTRCLNVCPTKALLGPGLLDARRCISYLTIELKEEIPTEFKPKLNNRVFGCDLCQDVCPWNQKLRPHKTDDFYPKEELLKMSQREWQNLSKEKYDSLFVGTPVERAGYQKLKGNIEAILSKES